MDADNGEVVPAERIRAALRHYAPLFEYLEDWDNGAFVITEREYLNKPTQLMAIRQLFRKRKAQFLNPKKDH